MTADKLSILVDMASKFESNRLFVPMPSGQTRVARATEMLGDKYSLYGIIDLNLSVSLEHIQTVANLITRTGNISLSAPYTLMRASLESVSQGMWLLGANTSSEMVTRLLCLEGHNIKKKSEVLTPPQEIDPFAELDSFTDSLDLGAQQIKRIKQHRIFSTEMMREGAKAFQLDSLPDVWRITSGFAHGFKWAYIGLSEITGYPADGEVQISSDIRAVELIFFNCIFSHKLLYGVANDLAKPVRAPGEGFSRILNNNYLAVTREMWSCTPDVLQEAIRPRETFGAIHPNNI